ncbi:hypothetical protein AD006_00260 [Pseudonocardia sp. EC080610-09]|uniref:hypothetical protein n=1 Tax=unclassified Pseudonocardia TaxID=2619320 RepID=UPI0006CB0708|nr:MULTISPECIES: hypothetical protein [unclassified Pseudonocardia]ALE74807.1 hypothetical protein FRP1_21070 [Pseudonocardia sp. EC080625-04]ALL74138.1 hypothetical protein AD006_00260 [Pseudonocardia sp. EC080610-09]ALL81163.1 hypothetical protein AD017_08085 [Pseudonocardia sp. EC080619-01]
MTPPDREAAALSDVLVLLDACTVSVAAVVAVLLLRGRTEDQLVTAAAGVFLAAVSTFLVRSVLGLDDSVFRQGLPVLAVVLLAAGFRLRGAGRRRSDQPRDRRA